MKRLVTSVALALGLFSMACTPSRVEPGNVGLKIHYDSGQIEVLKPGNQFWNTDPNVTLIKYPTTRQTLVMVKSPTEGQQKNDDSVPCTDREGNAVGWDMAVFWKVNEAEVVSLYNLFRNLPLDDPKSDVDISGTTVRNIARADIRIGCAQFIDIDMNTHRGEITTLVSNAISEHLKQNHLLLDGDITLRDLYLSPARQQQFQNRIEGQKALEQAEFARQQAEKKSQTDLLNIQAQQAQAKAQAEGSAEQARIKADSDSYVASKQAEANRQVAGSLTSDLIKLREVEKWDGHNSQTVLGENTAPQVQVR